jgi:carbamoyltransferase
VLFGFPRRVPEGPLEQRHCNLAFAIQAVTEEIVIRMAREAKRLTGADSLCLAGGVALNCVANGKLLQTRLFKNIYVQPAPGDAGGALGAALAVHYMYSNEKRSVDEQADAMNGSYLGPAYSDQEIQKMNKATKAEAHYFPHFSILADWVAGKIAEGCIVGWFQGRMEFGPRALGNRSILADARNADMQKKLNLKIKFREEFRPFAPSVLKEKAADYFDLLASSPYMLFVSPVKEARRKPQIGNNHSLSLLERLYQPRSDIQAITHLDFSARVQTVCKTTNPRYWELLNAFDKKTGHALLINTSFNVRDEPIVCTPHDAYRCFMTTEMDYLVLGNYLYHKTEQPAWEDKEHGLQKIKTDQKAKKWKP